LPGNARVQPQPVHKKADSFWRIGHRGFPHVAPENTIASFAKAVESGIDMVEFDVTMTRDGVPVVLHDKTLDRTTTGRGSVRRRTYSELQDLDAGSWFSTEFSDQKIPTLNDVLDFLKGKIAMNIEIKLEAVGLKMRGGIEQKVLQAVQKRGLTPHVVVSSFLPLAVKRIKKLCPEQSTALLLTRRPRRDPRVIADRVRADALHLPKEGVTAELIRIALSEGIPMRVFTVNAVKEMQKLLTWNVDGIFSDRADYFFKLTSGNGGPGLAM
jgi:glycerophosphoryl diester phosphodiesterase